MANMSDVDDDMVRKVLSRVSTPMFDKMAAINWGIGRDSWNLFGKGDTDHKEQILEVAGELALKFLCYDREEDPDLTEDDILNTIENGNVSVDEIVEAFRNSLLDNLPDK